MIFGVAKQYIWRCRIEKHPMFKGYLYLLSQYIETEHYIAEKNKKLEKHEKKWKHLPPGCLIMS